MAVCSKTFGILSTVVFAVLVYYSIQPTQVLVHLESQIQEDIGKVVDFWTDFNKLKEQHPYMVEFEILEEGSNEGHACGSWTKVRLVDDLKFLGRMEFVIYRTICTYPDNITLHTEGDLPYNSKVNNRYVFTSLPTETGDIESGPTTLVVDDTSVTVPRILQYYTYSETLTAHQQILDRGKRQLED